MFEIMGLLVTILCGILETGTLDADKADAIERIIYKLRIARVHMFIDSLNIDAAAKEELHSRIDRASNRIVEIDVDQETKEACACTKSAQYIARYETKKYGFVNVYYMSVINTLDGKVIRYKTISKNKLGIDYVNNSYGVQIDRVNSVVYPKKKFKARHIYKQSRFGGRKIGRNGGVCAA